MSHQILRHRGPYGAGLEADLAAVRSSEAQTTKITNLPSEDLKTLQKEGDSFTFNAFTSRDAWELGHLLHARLVRDPRATLISISLANGQVLFQTTTGAVTPDNEIWVARKRKTVTRFGVSSWQFHVKFDSDEDRFAAKYGMSKEQASGYAIHGGGVPIRVEGVEGVVAVVIVSGLAQAEDHGVIVDVIKENWEPVA